MNKNFARLQQQCSLYLSVLTRSHEHLICWNCSASPTPKRHPSHGERAACTRMVTCFIYISIVKLHKKLENRKARGQLRVVVTSTYQSPKSMMGATHPYEVVEKGGSHRSSPGKVRCRQGGISRVLEGHSCQRRCHSFPRCRHKLHIEASDPGK